MSDPLKLELLETNVSGWPIWTTYLGKVESFWARGPSGYLIGPSDNLTLVFERLTADVDSAWLDFEDGVDAGIKQAKKDGRVMDEKRFRTEERAQLEADHANMIEKMRKHLPFTIVGVDDASEYGQVWEAQSETEDLYSATIGETLLDERFYSSEEAKNAISEEHNRDQQHGS